MFNYGYFCFENLISVFLKDTPSSLQLSKFWWNGGCMKTLIVIILILVDKIFLIRAYLQIFLAAHTHGLLKKSIYLAHEMFSSVEVLKLNVTQIQQQGINSLMIETHPHESQMDSLSVPTRCQYVCSNTQRIQFRLQRIFFIYIPSKAHII